MKVAIVSPFENLSTGRGIRNVNIAEEFAKSDCEVTFITSNFDHGQKKIVTVKNIENVKNVVLGVPPYSKNLSVKRFLTHIVFALKLLRFFISQPHEIIYVSSIPPEVACVAALCKKKIFILDIRDIWPDALLAYSNVNLILRKMFNLYCKVLYRIISSRIDLVYLVAPGYLPWVRRFLGYNVKWKFMPLGFRESKNNKELINKNFSEKKYFFCYAGGLTPQFDVTNICRDLSKKSGIIVGSGPLLNKLKLEFPDLTFTGVVSREAAISFLRESEFAILPSNTYARLPNKIYDYILEGRKVILENDVSRECRLLLIRVGLAYEIDDGSVTQIKGKKLDTGLSSVWNQKQITKKMVKNIMVTSND
jgi:hypothetical protein